MPRVQPKVELIILLVAFFMVYIIIIIIVVYLCSQETASTMRSIH